MNGVVGSVLLTSVGGVFSCRDTHFLCYFHGAREADRMNVSVDFSYLIYLVLLFNLLSWIQALVALYEVPNTSASAWNWPLPISFHAAFPVLNWSVYYQNFLTASQGA